MNENKETQVTEETTEVKIVDRKAGFMDKVKEHKKAIIVGAGVIGAIAVAKIVKVFGNRSSNQETDEGYDDDFDPDVIDVEETQED